MKKSIVVNDKDELKQIIDASPTDADLNYLDVSNITDISWLFYKTKFDGDISNWNTKNVTNMKDIFKDSKV